MHTTIYQKIGGKNAINTAVDLFYRKILSDNRVSSFFDDIDMDQQILKQKGFLTMVLGGPNHYAGKDMRDGHRHLVKRGLNDMHVDIVLEHLRSTLAELGISKNDIDEVITTANSARADVLNR